MEQKDKRSFSTKHPTIYSVMVSLICFIGFTVLVIFTDNLLLLIGWVRNFFSRNEVTDVANEEVLRLMIESLTLLFIVSTLFFNALSRRADIKHRDSELKHRESELDKYETQRNENREYQERRSYEFQEFMAKWREDSKQTQERHEAFMRESAERYETLLRGSADRRGRRYGRCRHHKK